VGNHQQPIIRLSGSNHPVTSFYRERHRLFNKNVLASVQRCDSILFVQVRRKSYVNRVNIVVCG
jgi:hypothetical protein